MTLSIVSSLFIFQDFKSPWMTSSRPEWPPIFFEGDPYHVSLLHPNWGFWINQNHVSLPHINCRKLTSWKVNLGNKEFRVNIKKTKVMFSCQNMNTLLDSGMWPCGVCRSGVGSNFIYLVSSNSIFYLF